MYKYFYTHIKIYKKGINTYTTYIYIYRRSWEFYFVDTCVKALTPDSYINNCYVMYMHTYVCKYILLSKANIHISTFVQDKF